MLTLTREAGQAVWIGPHRIEIGRIKPSAVEVKLDVAREIPIRRAEALPPLAAILQQLRRRERVKAG